MASLLTTSFSAISLAKTPQQVSRARISSGRSGFLGSRPVSASAKTQVIKCPTVVECVKGGKQRNGKLKTRKAVSKRFKVTGSGLVRRRSQNKQHINEKMSRKKIKSLSKSKVVNNSDINNIKSCMPYEKIRKK